MTAHLRHCKKFTDPRNNERRTSNIERRILNKEIKGRSPEKPYGSEIMICRDDFAIYAQNRPFG